ncbi:MAG: hypothetical protein OEY11_02870 [Gammaproteobacteria bacterium]|nr:hypothetical protein [Gammaproteobacteria bacterium]
MNISLLTGLVIVESFAILLLIIVYLMRKHKKLKKAFDDLRASLSKNFFFDLLKKEIIKTDRHTTTLDDNELELSEDQDKDNSSKETKIRSMLKFRSSYLNAEINAFEESAGNKELFWHHLSENINKLMPKNRAGGSGSDGVDLDIAPPDPNEYLEEILREMQEKLDKSVESNVTLQAMLDSLLSDEKLAPDQVEIIKNAQADYHNLNENISDLENKLRKHLDFGENYEARQATLVDSEKSFFVEKKSHKVNTEVNKLKDIIYGQGSKINALLKSLREGNTDMTENSLLQKQLEELVESQKETSMCIEVLEMENQRLMEELESIHGANNMAVDIDGVRVSDMNPDQLRNKISELELLIEDKDIEYEKLNKELESLQTEFMAAYQRDAE